MRLATAALAKGSKAAAGRKAKRLQIINDSSAMALAWWRDPRLTGTCSISVDIPRATCTFDNSSSARRRDLPVPHDDACLQDEQRRGCKREDNVRFGLPPKLLDVDWTYQSCLPRRVSKGRQECICWGNTDSCLTDRKSVV